MMEKAGINLKIISNKLFSDYKNLLKSNLFENFEAVRNQGLEPHSFTFYTSVSVMFSSKIEGEVMDVDSYVKHKILNIEYLPNLTEKPNDLYEAYLFAKENKLTKENFLLAHKLIAAHLLPAKQQGVLRTAEMLIMEHNTGRIQFEAAMANTVKVEFNKLWKDIADLIKQNLDMEEVFYYASMIHLVFVNIHPFNDGNGRIARLLEKWFLVEKLGEKAWYIQSEKYYYNHVDKYYRNLSKVGMFYNELDYSKALPFLLMLPDCLNVDFPGLGDV